ncbi:MAG: nucleoside deaminase [Xenococcaceae cyanobacterium MO_188.B29]|nr:nucleoside deaminase [Xenococcaceae cyanobacterium MO_188.B29]
MSKKKVRSLKELNYQAYLKHRYWMGQCLKLAQTAATWGDVPVGAVMIDRQGNLITEAANCKEKNQDPTAHAEMIAIRAASQIQQNWHLNNYTLYVTLEPCPMCAGAILQARISTLVYGTDDPKTGAIRTVANLPDSNLSYHKLKVIAGIRELECRQQLQNWFESKRIPNSSSKPFGLK